MFHGAKNWSNSCSRTSRLDVSGWALLVVLLLEAHSAAPALLLSLCLLAKVVKLKGRYAPCQQATLNRLRSSHCFTDHQCNCTEACWHIIAWFVGPITSSGERVSCCTSAERRPSDGSEKKAGPPPLLPWLWSATIVH